MKKIVLILIALVLTGLGTAISVSAQITSLLVADIPFEFSVRDKTLPAGRYTIKEFSSPINKMMEITSQDGKTSALFPVENAIPNENLKKGELVFHHIGDQNFLFEIFDQWDDVGAMLPKSHTERLLEKELSNTESRIVTVSTLNLAANK